MAVKEDLTVLNIKLIEAETLANVEEIELSNITSDLHVRADLDQFDEKIELLTADIGITDTDVKMCRDQIELWGRRARDAQRRREQLVARRRALRRAKQTLENEMEVDG